MAAAAAAQWRFSLGCSPSSSKSGSVWRTSICAASRLCYAVTALSTSARPSCGSSVRTAAAIGSGEQHANARSDWVRGSSHRRTVTGRGEQRVDKTLGWLKRIVDAETVRAPLAPQRTHTSDRAQSVCRSTQPQLLIDV
eukprot:SAG11_NODE_799_length_7127_cov_3.180279_7_plen_139_part_00